MRKLRSLSKGKGGTIPAIALTGFTGSWYKALAQAAGYQVHMAKPVELDALMAEVDRLVARK